MSISDTKKARIWARGYVVFAAAFLSAVSLGLIGCKGKWENSLTETGFYVVQGGVAHPLHFREYGSGPTRRVLSASDFSPMPDVRPGGFLALYGDLAPGPMSTSVSVFPYEEVGEQFRSRGNEIGLETFFRVNRSKHGMALRSRNLL